MRPPADKNKGDRQQLYYGFRQTSLGLLLVAVTANGVCRMTFGESKDALAAEFSEAFPKAQLHSAEDDFQEWLDAAAESVEQPQSRDDLPLDIHGTAFQERVWQVIREIPYGKTRSYAEVARAAGKPKAIRAVASFCTKNPLAMVIPCHRVVGSDGKIHGQRWGIRRREMLTEKEAAG